MVEREENEETVEDEEVKGKGRGRGRKRKTGEDEGVEVVDLSSSSSSSPPFSLSAPTGSSLSSAYGGLKNLGATCYINAFLQVRPTRTIPSHPILIPS